MTTPLTLTLIQPPVQRVDLSPLVCQALTGKTLAEIGDMPLQYGKRRVRVAELFHVAGADPQHLVIQNGCDKLDFIGKGLQTGRIDVLGDAGAYCGMGLNGGQIRITGNVGMFAACMMRKGLLTIDGDADDFLGGALPGERQGMRGGTVVVKGRAGDRAGDRMRRGTILIEGDAGDYCGARMVAGTIAVMGRVGHHVGYAMNRGTILLWQEPASWPVTFNDCGTHTLSFLALWFKSLAQFDTRFADPQQPFQRVQRYAGDVAALGRGEILCKRDRL